MSYDQNLSEFHQPLDDLEQRLAEMIAEAEESGPVPSHQIERKDEILAETGAMRRVLQEAEESTWEVVKLDVEADWQALTKTFDRWIEHVDEDYRSRNP